MSNHVVFTDDFGNMSTYYNMSQIPVVGEHVKVFDYLPIPKVVEVHWLLKGGPTNVDVMIKLG